MPGRNGSKACTDGVPVTVIVLAATCVFVSLKRLLWHVNSLVFVIPVSGDVGTVRVDDAAL